MHWRHIITGGVILSALFQWPAQACSDDSCYPTWDLKKDLLDTCNNTPFLSPPTTAGSICSYYWLTTAISP